jgi:cysteine desulfurase / selenocysteine lyase
VRALLNAAHADEIVFTRGTTEAINLVAQSWGRASLSGPATRSCSRPWSTTPTSCPWQLLCERTGAVLKVVPGHRCRANSSSMPSRRLLGERTRLFAVDPCIERAGHGQSGAHADREGPCAGALVLVDGAQAVAHQKVDVQALGCDFYAFSGHKLYGPTGIGALYARARAARAMPPWQGGGDMIRTVSFEGSTWADAPQRFEAGTPNIAGAIGLAAAIDYVQGIGLERVAAHERALLAYATEVPAPFPACASSAPPGTRRASCRSSSTASIRTTSAPFWTPKASRSAPATTAQCR